MTAHSQMNSLERLAYQRGLERLKNKSPAAWIQRHFWIPETREPIQLVDYQAALVDHILTTDEAGHYPYSIVIWSDIKKSAKSTIAAAMVDYVASHTGYGSIKIVANDLKQADSRVAYYLRRALQGSGRDVRIRNYNVDYPATHARVEAIPVDPKGEAGGNDDLIVFSELWAANQKAALRMWSEMTLSPTKFGRSFRLVETYAGFSGESPLLEDLYATGVKEGRHIGAELGFPDLEVYVNDAARMLCLWNTRPRCPWQSDEYYAQEAALLTPEEFQRMHRNQWVSSTEAFVQPDEWQRCLATADERQRHALGRMGSLVVGIDCGLANDEFGIVAVSRRDDELYVQYARRWVPPKDGLIKFGSEHEPDTPVYELCRLAKQYSVWEFAYDPWQLEKLAQDLHSKGLGRFIPIPQGSVRPVADKMLYDAIRQRHILHQGHVDLTEHVTNANRKAEGENKIRMVKRNPKLKIDLAVALSMAVYRAYEALPG